MKRKVKLNELEPVYFVRIGGEKKFDDDYGFEFDGETYYINRQVKDHCNLLLFKVLDAFNAECAKNRLLERKFEKLKIKAAKYDGFMKAKNLSQIA